MRALLFGAIVLAGVSPAQAAGTIQGEWYTKDRRAIVTIAPCGPQLCGKLSKVLRPTPGGHARDVQNPEPALRKRPLLGINILSGFARDGQRWRGKIYDPESGKTYRSIVTKGKTGVLNVEGCVAMFCQSQTWSQVQ